MNPKLAQGIFLGLNVAAVFAVAYVVQSYLNTQRAIDSLQTTVTFDNSDYFFLLMSVFWLLGALQLAGLRGHLEFVKRRGSALVIGWFFACIALIVALAHQTDRSFEQAGYVACRDANVWVGQLLGATTVYDRAGCRSLAAQPADSN